MLISPFLEIILSIALDHQACYILLWLFHWPGKPSCQLLENSGHRLHLPLLLALCSQTYSCSEKTFPRDPSLAVFPFCTSPRLCRLVHQPQTPCPQGCSADLPAIGLLRVLRKKKKKKTELNGISCQHLRIRRLYVTFDFWLLLRNWMIGQSQPHSYPAATC